MKRLPPGYQGTRMSEPEWFKNTNQLIGTQKTFFPRSINFEDIDKAVLDWFSTREIMVGEKPVPVFYLTPEKWAEFKHSWSFSDGNHNIKFPYITVRRSQAPKLGEPLKGRIPGRKFTSYKMPVYGKDGIRYKFYKVPQPIKVDLEYEVRALTHYISDINIINEALLRHFASLQSYLDIDKHYMPMMIESVSDESDFDNLEEERVIHTLYSIIVHGYIIDEAEFEESFGVKDVRIEIKEEVSTGTLLHGTVNVDTEE